MKKILSLIFFVSIISSCKKNEDTPVEPLRDYAEQYATDLANIETYLNTHKILHVENAPGLPSDQDVTFETTTVSSESIMNQTAYPLLSWNVDSNGVTYKVYYLVLRQGSGINSNSPTNVDGVLAAYKGQLLDGTVFDQNQYPQSYLSLTNVIQGWSEIFPKFKTGDYTENADGTISYTNFGAGVMFIPSGLGYYSNSLANIPSYSPLIFSFKLYEIKRYDQDGDGIYSYQEDINHDGYLRNNTTTYEDDTDHDGIPDYLDADDDGDNYLTKVELRRPESTGFTDKYYYYNYDGAAVNDPLTPYNDMEGAPSCSGDFYSPTRLRKYLDKNCH